MPSPAVYYTDEFVLPLPPEHRFPMDKYRLLRERLLDTHVLTVEQLRVPDPATGEALQRVHDADYVRRVVEGTLGPHEVRRLGFPWSAALVERSRRSVGATIAAARSACRDGLSVNLAGGTHHASVARGEGYCVFNDVAVACRALQAEGKVERALVVDCDVHQGNGTAAIFAADPSVFTLSIHGAKNYPFRKVPGDLDVGLADGTTDREYLDALDAALATALRAGPYDLAVYVAGADPYRADRLGRLALSKAGLAERDRRALGRLRRATIPVAVVMAGGYSPEVTDIVDIHAATVVIATQVCASGVEPILALR